MYRVQDSIQANCHIIFDSIEEGVFTVDLDWRITSFNRAAEKITGISRTEAIGKQCLDVFRTNVCNTDCVLKKTIAANRPAFNVPVYMIRSDAKRIPVTVNATILRDHQGRVIGGVETFRDLSNLAKLHRSFVKYNSFENMVSKNQKMLQIFPPLSC